MNVQLGKTTYAAMEWENIPALIPMAFNEVNSLIKSIHSWMASKDAEEPLSSINAKISGVASLVEQRSGEIYKKQAQDFEELKAKFEEVWTEINILKEKPEVSEAIVQTELLSCDLEESGDISEEEHSEGEDEKYSTRPSFDGSFKDRQKDTKDTDFARARMYSLNTIRKLIYKYLNRSFLKSRFYNYKEEVVPAFHKKLQEVLDESSHNEEESQVEFKRIYEKFDYYHNNIQKLYTEVESKLSHIVKWSEKVDGKISDYNSNFKDIRNHQDEIDDNLTIMKENSKKLEEKNIEALKESKDYVKKRAENLKKNQEREVEAIKTSVDNLKNSTTEKITALETSLLDEIVKEISEVTQKTQAILEGSTANIEQQIHDYQRIHLADSEQFTKQFNEFKNEATEFNKKANIELKKLRMDFDRWVSTVMEPAHVSEARVFAVEAKVKEEEAARLEMIHFTKDVIKKLVYSLEQIQMIDGEDNKILFLKRLAFLKKILSIKEEVTRPNTSLSKKKAIMPPITSSEHKRAALTSYSPFR